MKRHTNFWFVMFLTISLILPIYSMAQTAAPVTKLTLESSSGDRISGANVKAFSLGPDNNLVVYLDGPFTAAALMPDISLSSCTNCTISTPAFVTTTVGSTLSFVVSSTNRAAVISLIADPLQDPPRVLSSANGSTTFDWNTTNFQPGSYLAVFQATVGIDISQLVVMITVNPPGYSLTVNVNAQGCAGSSVTKNPDKQAYDLSTPETVTLTAVPASGCYFSGWAVDLTGTTNPSPLTMNGNKTVTANFAPIPTYTLNVTPSGPGTVTKNPDKTPYNQGESVTLTAIPGAGYSFVNWTVDLTGTTNPVTLTMNANKTITANFAVTPTYSINIYTSGTGIVTKSPDKASYNSGESVTLTATPTIGTGATFINWTGDLIGSANPVTITMDNNKTITANFGAAQTYSINLYISGTGTVTRSPDKTLYSSGESVTLTATPGTGATFANWTGDLTGTTNPVTLTMNANKTLTANFTTSGGGGVVYTKLNNIAPGSGDFYGTGYDSYTEGQTKRYTLPLAEVYPGKSISRLLVKTAAMIDGRGDVSMKLTSPDGLWSRISDGAFADETLNAIGTSYPMGANYPAAYLDNGNWTLEITGKVASDIKIWWKCY